MTAPTARAVSGIPAKRATGPPVKLVRCPPVNLVIEMPGHLVTGPPPSEYVAADNGKLLSCLPSKPRKPPSPFLTFYRSEKIKLSRKITNMSSEELEEELKIRWINIDKLKKNILDQKYKTSHENYQLRLQVYEAKVKHRTGVLNNVVGSSGLCDENESKGTGVKIKVKTKKKSKSLSTFIV